MLKCFQIRLGWLGTGRNSFNEGTNKGRIVEGATIAGSKGAEKTRAETVSSKPVASQQDYLRHS